MALRLHAELRSAEGHCFADMRNVPKKWPSRFAYVRNFVPLKGIVLLI